jgi:small-conductance mechanosensitive channel
VIKGGRGAPSMRKAVWLLLAVLAASLPAAARAAAPAHASAAAPAHASTAPAQLAPVSVGELQGLVDTLQDESARGKLVAQLQALIAAQRQTTPKKPEGIELLGRLSRQIDAFTGEILAGAAMVVDAPRLIFWAREQIYDPTARQRWVDAAVALVLVFGTAAAAEWALRWVIARARPKFPVRRRDTRSVRVLFALLGLVFDLVPLLVFAAIAYGAVAMALDPMTPTRITLSVLAVATIEARLILCLARAVLLPPDDGALFLRLDAETRNYLYIWVKRFAFWGVYGYAVPKAAWWLGIPGALYTLMLKLVGLVLALLAIVFLLQNRVQIADWIGGERSTGSGWGRVRRTLAEIWQLLAIFYIGGLYAIYAVHIEGGFVYVARATALSVLVIVAARVLAHSIRGLSRRGFAISPQLQAQFPTLEQRANRYVPILTGLASTVLYVVAGLSVLQAWEVSAFAWLDTDLARRLGGDLLSIGLIVAAALAVWEVFASAIERYLSKIDGGVPRRTRVRTLLPLLRTAMLSLIVVMSALIILSHLGIDIAPLLAGAGVVGVAIGFGSQALVKDVITGLFILLEDQLAVGDIVDVGKDHAGVVEAISVRTIRLRDQSGTVHTVPFSEVMTVKNMTREYAYVAARVTIAYGEDIDRVVEILRAASTELMEDETLRDAILDPFEYLGVDALNDSSVVLLVRIRTLPAKQYPVGRAFNRLVKIAFDKHGIASRDPSPVLISTPPAAPAETGLGQTPPERRRLA